MNLFFFQNSFKEVVSETSSEAFHLTLARASVTTGAAWALITFTQVEPDGGCLVSGLYLVSLASHPVDHEAQYAVGPSMEPTYA